MAKKKLTTRILAEAEYDRWNELVASASGGSIYSMPQYLETLCVAAGGGFRILGIFKSEELVGGIALYEASSPFGKCASTRLLLYYNGIVLRDYDIKYPSERVNRQVAAMQALEESLSALGYGRILLRNRSSISDLRAFLSRGWKAWPSYSYVVSIAELSSTWERIEQNLRRLIIRCEDRNISFTDDDDFDSFYKLHYQSHKRKGAPLYLSRDQFRRYFEGLKKQGLCRLYHARGQDGRSLATQLVLLGCHPVSHTVCAAAEAKFLNLGTTPFLWWKAFGALAQLGYQANDLTDAALNTVTRFKSQLGGELEVNFVLTRPDTLRYRIGEGCLSVAKRILGPAYLFLKRR